MSFLLKGMLMRQYSHHFLPPIYYKIKNNYKRTLSIPCKYLEFFGNIHKSYSFNINNPMPIVYMPENMIFWLYLKHSFLKSLRTSVNIFSFICIKDAKRWPMSNQNIDFRWKGVPNFNILFLGILKSSTRILRSKG